MTSRPSIAAPILAVRRTAITLVELLVVLVILLGLLALLFPAVQSARESARATTCRSNLRQLSLAMQMYVDAEKRVTDIAPPNCGGGWCLAILPFMQNATAVDYPSSTPLTATPTHLLQRPLCFSCPSAQEAESAVWPVQAAQYGLIVYSRRDSWSVADVPLAYAVPWIASPELSYSDVNVRGGPHHGGAHIANSQGDVRLTMPESN
jgi:type II secretory pathway pseudopilin PulG